MYQVGKLEYCERDDPNFENWKEAVDSAVDKSMDDSVYAIWRGQEEGSELLAIVYQGEVFEK